MRKLFVSLVIASILLAAAAVPVWATDIRIAADGVIQADLDAVAVDGHLLVSVYSLAEIIDAEIHWTPERTTLVRGPVRITIETGSDRMTIRRDLTITNIDFEVAPIQRDGTWFYPFEAVVQAFGIDVGWNAEARVVFIGAEPDLSEYITAAREAAEAAEQATLAEELRALREELYAVRAELDGIRAGEAPSGTVTRGGIINFAGISWIVLEAREDMSLIISERVLFPGAYHSEWEDVTWETSSLRGYLNSTFINNTFSEEERARIAETTLVNSPNRSFNIPGGNDTADRVFLLSIEEAHRHFASDSVRVAYNMNGVVSGWWLRSPGMLADTAARIGPDGIIYVIGDFVENHAGGVRPALWLRNY